MRLLVGHTQAGDLETPRANPCQFSTFKSSPSGRAAADVASLDLTGLNLGHRDTVAANRATELNSSTSRDYYQPMNRLRERSPNASSRQLDKQSYFFHGHKTEKDIDREAVLFDCNTPDEIKFDYTVDDVAASVGSMNCFGGGEKEKSADHEEKKQKSSALGSRRLAGHDSRRDSGNVEFLEKEGEIFKKSSNELLQETSTKKKRNFSFNNKEKTHRSLESLERSVDLSVVDCKSLVLLDDQPKTFFYGRQKTLDFSQKSKKSMDSSANKARKRPNFFQRVRRRWHFLLKQRRIRRRNKYERPQSAQEKCEYFLQKYQKNDFFERIPSLPRSSTVSELRFFYVSQFFRHESKDSKSQKEVTAQLEDSTFRVKAEENKSSSASEKQEQPVAPASDSHSENTPTNVESTDKKLLETVTSVTTQESASCNKESVEIGYSISQLSKLCLQNLQNVNRTDALHPQEVANTDKKEQFMEWIVRTDLDTLSYCTNSSDSLGNGKLQGNLDILKGILLDIFLCTCI
ncbi:uncharacterized protein LOC143188250 [Calliopsis andreniformis]|uniref:uncharacterized protein LOC143188250 n=1 Tax=Calliopsis andreniformis TaxID=337506 RepID=UPI003FCE333F